MELTEQQQRDFIQDGYTTISLVQYMKSCADNSWDFPSFLLSLGIDDWEQQDEDAMRPYEEPDFWIQYLANKIPNVNWREEYNKDKTLFDWDT